MSLQPYAVILPDTEEPALTLELDRKTGTIPKGTYEFIEFYCTDPKCDCRRVTLFVVNEKMKEKAVISMGFDPLEPMAGPFLDDIHKQSSYAEELTALFVDMINDGPDILEMLYRHYREVRSKVEGKKYLGKAFPKAGRYIREMTPSSDLSGFMMNVMCTIDANKEEKLPVKGRNKKASSACQTSVGVRFFAERYYNARNQSYHFEHQNLMDELRRYILDHDLFALEISSLLVELCDVCSEDDERINSALQVLSDMLEILRIELERQRPGSVDSMERLQRTLAQKIFIEYGEADLCAAVSHTLLQSRVELLPVLHDANSQRMLLNAAGTGVHDMPEERVMNGLFKSLDEMGINSPFEALENLLRLLALGPAQMQIALCGEMLDAESLLVRDTAALMLLHPSPDVRRGVAELLVTVGKKMTPDSLRRLIVARNWFPEAIRKNIDQAVSNARKGRVECAPLPKSLESTVYASPVDGAFAQSFQVIIPSGKGFTCCSILLKQGVGVADAFVVSFPAKRDLEDFLAMMSSEGAFIESSMTYLDQRVCHALAEGAALGKAPNYWLLHVAETLGKDQWKAIPFQPQRELENLRAALSCGSPEFLTDKSRKISLEESADWGEYHDFTSSWFEDDADVDRLIEGVMKKKHKEADGECAAVFAIIDNILEKRRSIWLERLTLCAMWLKSSSEAPLPWYQMLFLADAVDDESIPLAEVPLMEAIAVQTLMASLARSEEDYC